MLDTIDTWECSIATLMPNYLFLLIIIEYSLK